MQEAPLREALWQFTRNIFWLSLLLSVVAGVLVYLMLDFTVVRPMRMVTASIIKFRNDPGALLVDNTPSTRKDEVGIAQNALRDMEAVVSDAFRQRERLAQLGEAVAKINHDLRNSLAAAQLVSDSLAQSQDPRVMRAAPRLERALERAINLAQDTLDYGKSEPSKPKFQTLRICETILEATAEALIKYPDIKLEKSIGKDTVRTVDPDNLYRIVSNLVRNAAAATSKKMKDQGVISISLEGNTVIIADNGPGLPKKTIDNLFVPFAGSATKGGTGLGLAIARDLSRAMGGDLTLGSTGADGTTFHVTLPDMPKNPDAPEKPDTSENTGAD
jgi:signal transduction histidine kinase